jgi:uncharacterized protein YkwD
MTGRPETKARELNQREHRGNRGHRGRGGSIAFRALCGLHFLSVAGCASGGAPVVVSDRGVGGPPPSSTLSPSTVAAEFYTTRVSPAFMTDPLAGQFAAEIDSGRKGRGQAPLVRDGRLDRVAYDLALATGGLRAPAPDSVAFLLWHYGVPEPEPNLFLVRGDDGAEATALAGLQAQFAAASASPLWRRVGLGVARVARKWTVVIVFQEKNLDLDPVPRRLAAGEHVNVAGRVRATFRSPEVLLTSPAGAVKRLATRVEHDTYSARLDCSLGNGGYQVEVSAQDERGPRVLANFPVYCGVVPPSAFVFTSNAPGPASDPADVERQLLDLLDRDRKASGLPVFARDARLAPIARRYSREMAETGEVAHVSRRTGSVVDRVTAAGIAPMPTVIAENVGSAASAADAESAFMASPGHRDNILNPALTHVGVGVAMGRQDGGGVLLFFAQVFAGFRK